MDGQIQFTLRSFAQGRPGNKATRVHNTNERSATPQYSNVETLFAFLMMSWGRTY